MTSIVRRATEADFAGIGEVLGDGQRAHAEALPAYIRHTPGAFASQAFQQSPARLIGDDAERALFVAERDGHIIGTVTLTLRDTPESPFEHAVRVAYLSNLAVRAGESGKGTGTALIEAALQWARDKGAQAVDLDVFAFNQRANAFFERLGFSTLQRITRHPL